MMFLFLFSGWIAFVVLACLHFTRTRRFPVLLVLLALVLVPATFLEARWRHHERQYTQVARELTGIGDVEVVCQRLGSDLVDVSMLLGYVPYNADGTSGKFAFLRRETCKGLARFKARPSAAGSAEWMAVHVLSHEAMHLAGEHNEAKAECAAQQRNAITAQLLGASERQARVMSLGYRATGYQRLPDQYRSKECADGGAWDEDLPLPPWDDERRGAQRPAYAPDFADGAAVLPR